VRDLVVGCLDAYCQSHTGHAMCTPDTRTRIYTELTAGPGECTPAAAEAAAPLLALGCQHHFDAWDGLAGEMAADPCENAITMFQECVEVYCLGHPWHPACPGSMAMVDAARSSLLGSGTCDVDSANLLLGGGCETITVRLDAADPPVEATGLCATAMDAYRACLSAYCAAPPAGFDCSPTMMDSLANELTHMIVTQAGCDTSAAQMLIDAGCATLTNIWNQMATGGP
jgi:hypothetical protein